MHADKKTLKCFIIIVGLLHVMLMITSSSSSKRQMLVYGPLQLFLLSTQNLVHLLTFFQEQKGWHSLDGPLLSNTLKTSLK